MRLIAISRILNEADIVEAFVRHTSALVDHHILLDNGSTDATLNILSSLHREGLNIEVHHSDAIAFAQTEQNNFLFRQAAGERGADWVLPLDADEFIDVRAGGAAMRAGLLTNTRDACKVRVREYIPSLEDDPAELLVPARITRAYDPTNNVKVIARGNLLGSGGDLRPGSHSIHVRGHEVAWQILEDVVYAHYATRSSWQWVTKFVIGWSKVLAAGEPTVTAGHSRHYRDPFRLLKNDPAAILRNQYLLESRQGAGMATDPLPYRGGPLRYTTPIDHQMRAVQSLLTHLERLSMHHGELAAAASHAVLPAIEQMRIDVLARIDQLKPMSLAEPAPESAEIVAHAQDIGDIGGNLGDWIGERRSGRWIEGFRVAPRQKLNPDEFWYRVVLGRDQLSPWAPAGKFCGSMGLALPLRGFCVALQGAAAAKYECAYTATFVDGAAAGLVSGGRVCSAATLAPLEAFHIILRPRGA